MRHEILQQTTISVAEVERHLGVRTARTIPPTTAPRRAAVAVVLRQTMPEAPTEILYIRRTDKKDDPWSGQMAFPGGHIEPDDAGPVAAAIRETEEELSLPLARVGRLLGRLDDLTAMARGKLLPLAISPVVFSLLEDHPLTPHPEEVADYVWLPLLTLASGAHDDMMRYRRDDIDVRLPCWQVGPYCIWGLTYVMTLDLLRRLGAPLEIPPFYRAAQSAHDEERGP